MSMLPRHLARFGYDSSYPKSFSSLSRSLLTTMLSLLLTLAGSTTQAQKLLVVGGALSSENTDVIGTFIKHRAKHQSDIAIVPLASSSPVKSANSFRDALVLAGANEQQIRILPLAVTDDSSTDFDERQWASNSNDQALADSLKNVGAFWFVGGDQMRIVKALRPERRSTAVLSAIYQQWEKGAVIGGTSAGAAMMSEIMIAAGDSFNAVTQPIAENYSGTESQEQGLLYLHHGLGLFKDGVIDQHFDRKARLGRLVKTLAHTQSEFGYGVDEDTGMLLDLKASTLTVVGSGNITIVDARTARFDEQPFTAEKLQLSVLSSGDQWSLQHADLVYTPGKPTIGREYASEAPHQGAGLALANARLNQLLGYQLLDNSGSQEIRRYSFVESGSGFLYRFRQTSDSRGYWAARQGSVDSYTAINVAFDLLPVTVQVQMPGEDQ